jgi:hypothetical protein
VKQKLTKWVYEDPLSKDRFYIHVPLIDLFLVMNHRIGSVVRCYLDTGATVSIFPLEYASSYLGLSDKTIKNGAVMPVVGVGGINVDAYGHKCTFQHPDFCIKDVMVYFLKDQPYPLLGISGFVDHFKKIIIDEEEKTLELIY